MGTRMMKFHWPKRLVPALPLLLLVGCEPDVPETTPPAPTPAQPAIAATPLFDADSAYAFIAKQVAFGPRVPGTKGHKACGDWMVGRSKAAGATVVEQTG